MNDSVKSQSSSSSDSDESEGSNKKNSQGTEEDDDWTLKENKKNKADSEEERESEGDFIDQDDIIIMPEDLFQSQKGNRLDKIGTLNQLSKREMDEILIRGLEDQEAKG